MREVDMEMKYWKVIKSKAKKLLADLRDRERIEVNGYICEKERGKIIVQRKGSDAESDEVKVYFMFDDVPHLEPGTSEHQLTRVNIVNGGKTSWTINLKNLSYVFEDSENGISYGEISWDSGDPNTTLYGHVSRLYLLFNEGNDVKINYPWNISAKIAAATEAYVQELTKNFKGEKISLTEDIDFDKKMAELFLLSGINEI
jgi:hypothetical protein